MGRGKRGGAVGLPPVLDSGARIVPGLAYMLVPLGEVGRIELFDPSEPGWSGMGLSASEVGAVMPGDTFIAVDRVDSSDTDELWLVLCRGVLGKCILAEWELRGIRPVSSPEGP